MIKYSVIVPLFNEEEVVGECYNRIKSVMEKTNDSYEIIFVNDGSRDDTPKKIKALAEADKSLKILSFSRNFGHQAAISAGMKFSSGQAVVVIDADMQDPPEVILEMINLWKKGNDVVYGKRTLRKGESGFKKVTAKLFYRALSSISDIKIPVDAGDFRLLDRKVCDVVNSMPEKSRYVRGLVSWAGFSQTEVLYAREKRFAGKTKYPLSKMIRFAKDAVTSFSIKPLKISAYCGYFLSFSSFLYLVYIVLRKLILDDFEIGWASFMAISLFFNGIILIVLGILGEYIGRIYEEAKGRPMFIVDEKINFEEDKDK